jgi:hypothetical protein
LGLIDLIVTEGFEAWFASLEQSEAERVVFAVELLRESEQSLGAAFVDVQGQGAVVRVYMAFDAARRELTLLHGVHLPPHATPAHALA